MQKFKKHIILLLSLSITIFSFGGFTSSLTDQVYADGLDVVVNPTDSGFYFTIGERVVTVTSGEQLVGIGENGSVNQYYFSEPFNLDGSNLKLTPHQQNMLVTSTENSRATRVRVGSAIDRINKDSTVSVYSDESLTQKLMDIPVATEIKVINSVLDGKMKVLTQNGEGFIDSRYVRILEDTLPSNIKEFDISSPYVMTVNQKNRILKVYAINENGLYDLVTETPVTTGRVEEATPNGLFFTTGHKGEWFNSGDEGGGAKNFVQFRGNYLFHSTLFSSPDQIKQSSIEQLGQKASDGCIRVPLDISKWIYDTIPAGTLVIIDNADHDLNTLVQNKNI